MTEIIAAVAGIIGTIIVSVFTYFMARRAGIGPYQDTIVAKLKVLVELQENEISSLKKDKDTFIQRISELEKRVDELEDLTVTQALLIDQLTKNRRRRTSAKTTPQEGDI